ncbi:MAG: cyclase family protein [Sphaerobacter sp.]|nr:cyclase family protein [Sphaerobacter sp.]
MPSAHGFLDITLALGPHLPVWPGDPTIRLDPAARIAAGDGVNVSRLQLGTHAGTHLDPPFHVRDDGARVDELPLDALIGPCWVCDLTPLTAHIDAGDLRRAGIPAGTQRLLLKTRNSRLWSTQPHAFTDDFVALTPAAARWVVDAGIRLIGIDYLSIEPFDGDGETHRILLSAGVIAVEGLDLGRVSPGAYTLLCLPLKIAGGDGAPCRAVLAPLAFGGQP